MHKEIVARIRTYTSYTDSKVRGLLSTDLNTVLLVFFGHHRTYQNSRIPVSFFLSQIRAKVNLVLYGIRTSKQPKYPACLIIGAQS